MTEQPIKGIDLSLDNIELNQPKQKNTAKALLQENKFLKKQNEVLRRELENISSRLDAEIKKRIDQSKKKYTSRSDEVSQMELQNAYKKYQIYKREAEQYKKKLQTLSDDRMQDFQRRVNSYAKENYELKEEIKQLKKINKQQEKGLTQFGVEGYSSIVNQRQNFIEEIRILKKQVDNYRRALQKTKTHSSHFESRANDGVYERRVSSKRAGPESRLEERIKKKIKTETVEVNEDLTDLLHQKVEKDYHKLRTLATEKNKMRQLVDNLKLQLFQRQKQNVFLKEKISDLRKNNHILQIQVLANRSQSDLIDSKVRKQREHSEKYPKGIRERPLTICKQIGKPKSRVWRQGNSQTKEVQSEISKNSIYPRIQERGSVMENAVKWSHQHLSSKIKQMHVLVHHQNGHIKDLHIRYEKGQPKKYDQSGQQHKYSVFVCSEDEFIQNIEGAFCEGYLQYLSVTSNHRRVERYGNAEGYEGKEEPEYFQFEVEEKQYPGALFGENDEAGIIKLGCFIHKES